MKYYMVYRKDSDGSTHQMIATAKEEYAKIYADGLNESAKKYRPGSVYYYEEEEDYCVAITYDNDFGQEITKSHNGSKEDCERWIASVMKENDKMLFCLDFDNPDYEWHTLEEIRGWNIGQ